MQSWHVCVGPYSIITRQRPVQTPRMLLDVWLDSQPTENSIDGGCCVWVNASLSSKRLGHNLTTKLPTKSRGRKAPLCDSQHMFFPLRSPCTPFSVLSPPPHPTHIFFSLFLSSLVLRTQRGSGTCGHLSKLTCLSERHELTVGKLPKTTTFRSRSPFLS